MRRIAFAVAAAVTALVAGGAAGAAAGDSSTAVATSLPAGANALSGNQGADIYGVGGGKADYGLQKFNFSAHEGPDGDFGHVGITYYNPLGGLIVSYSVDVTCVNIHNLAPLLPFDRGWIRGVVTKITPVPNLLMLDVGDTVDFGIKDGGNPSSGPVDDFFAPGSQAVPWTAPCTAFFYFPGDLDNVTQGNVNIKGP